MLIRDPYLASDVKPRSFSAYPTNNPIEFNRNIGEFNKNIGEFNNHDKQFSYKNKFTTRQSNRNQFNNPNQKIQTYQNQIKSLSQAYRTQQQALKKVTNYQSINQEYHEAMKQRNYQLNTKLNDIAYQKSLILKRHEQQALKNTYDKDLILKKYQEQNQQILKLKRSVSEHMQHKARLQSQIDHLMFLMEKENHQGSLQIKQQLIRMQNMERTLRGIVDTKDQQITQLRHRLKVYEDQNRRLNDLNKTLTITRQQKIDNLSNIENIDSNMKIHNKQNIDINRKDDLLLSQLKQQKQLNQQLLSQMNLMKKKLFEDRPPKIKQNQQRQQPTKQATLKSIQKLNQIRYNLNTKLYDTYAKSISQGQKQKKNSLLIFIQNYKKLNFHQHSNQVNEYTKIRQELKSIHKVTKDSQLKLNIQMQVPLKLNSRQHSKDSQWVLSTMQFTKNQKKQNDSKQGHKQIGNNALLYLFRLLTIEYRIKNPLEGKILLLQNDVNNQLLHSIVKALQSLLQVC